MHAVSAITSAVPAVVTCSRSRLQVKGSMWVDKPSAWRWAASAGASVPELLAPPGRNVRRHLGANNPLSHSSEVGARHPRPPDSKFLDRQQPALVACHGNCRVVYDPETRQWRRE